MYFNKTNHFFHGIMLHHFHDDKMHTRGQGSISKDDFYKLIKFIGRENILDADIFFEKFKKNKLKENEVCLTFDDGIKSQIDVALPVLEDLKIKSFFFVYTSLFNGKPDNLEIFRNILFDFDIVSPDQSKIKPNSSLISSSLRHKLTKFIESSISPPSIKDEFSLISKFGLSTIIFNSFIIIFSIFIILTSLNFNKKLYKYNIIIEYPLLQY